MTNLYHQREALKARGMYMLNWRAESDEPAREYWGYTDRDNAMGDHTATLTHVGNEEWVMSDFTKQDGPSRKIIFEVDCGDKQDCVRIIVMDRCMDHDYLPMPRDQRPWTCTDICEVSKNKKGLNLMLQEYVGYLDKHEVEDVIFNSNGGRIATLEDTGDEALRSAIVKATLTHIFGKVAA
jgi:hypothetical protein